MGSDKSPSRKSDKNAGSSRSHKSRSERSPSRSPSHSSRKSKKSKRSKSSREHSRSPGRSISSKRDSERRGREKSRSREKDRESRTSSRDRRRHSHKKRSRRAYTPSDISSRTRVTGDNETTVSYGDQSWSSNKERELIHLREMVKNQKIASEFSFPASEISGIMQDRSLDDPNNNSDAASVHSKMETHETQNQNEHKDKKQDTSDKSMQDLIFEGVTADPKGPPVGDISSRLIDEWFSKDVDSDYIKSLRDAYPEPENTAHLSPKVMNVEIFRTMQESVKKRDFVLRSIQHNMVTAAISNFRLIDDLLKNQQQFPAELGKELAKHSSATAKLLAKASSDLSLARKQLVKNHLHFRYAPLCAERCYTKHLFGEDFSKVLKEADEISKITKALPRPANSFKADKNQYGQRYNPMHSKQKRGGFLKNQRGGYQQQQPQQYRQQKKPARTQPNPNQNNKA